MRRLGWWLTWVKAICPKAPTPPLPHTHTASQDECVEGGLDQISDWVTTKNYHNRLKCAFDQKTIQKKNTTLPHMVGLEWSRSIQNPRVSLWASTMTAWGASRIRWRLMLQPPKKRKGKKNPCMRQNICQGKREIHKALADYTDLTHQRGHSRGQTPQLSQYKGLSLCCNNVMIYILNLDWTEAKIYSHVVKTQGEKWPKVSPCWLVRERSTNRSSFPLGIMILKRRDILCDILICPLLREYSIMFWLISVLTFISTSSKVTHYVPACIWYSNYLFVYTQYPAGCSKGMKQTCG